MSEVFTEILYVRSDLPLRWESGIEEISRLRLEDVGDFAFDYAGFGATPDDMADPYQRRDFDETLKGHIRDIKHAIDHGDVALSSHTLKINGLDYDLFIFADPTGGRWTPDVLDSVIILNDLPTVKRQIGFITPYE